MLQSNSMIGLQDIKTDNITKGAEFMHQPMISFLFVKGKMVAAIGIMPVLIQVILSSISSTMEILRRAAPMQMQHCMQTAAAIIVITA